MFQEFTTVRKQRSGKLPTGGPLNFLNEKARTNSRVKTVPVMQLVSRHKPQTPQELEQLISLHSTASGCSCGIYSNGSVQDFASNLYCSQFTCNEYRRAYKGHRIFYYQECYHFMYTLFCVAPLQGLALEERSKKEMIRMLAFHGITAQIQEATLHDDFSSAVDYLIRCGTIIVGIQVKPSSFFRRRDCVETGARKHERFPHPVFYHVYSNKTLLFEKTEAIEFVRFEMGNKNREMGKGNESDILSRKNPASRILDSCLGTCDYK